MGLFCGRVFGRQRVGQVGIEEQMPALPLHQKAALAEPPEVKTAGLRVAGCDVVQKESVLLKWRDHEGIIADRRWFAKRLC